LVGAGADRLDETELLRVIGRGNMIKNPHLDRGYCAMKPPSMTSSAPVTNEASSEARNKTP
jgi:hypothetical protein